MTTVLGRRGTTLETFAALEQLALSGAVDRAIMTDFEGRYEVRHHGFLLVLKDGGIQVVADGFTSGYQGGGVDALMAAIRVLRGCEIPLHWVETEAGVGDDLFDGELDEAAICELVDASQALKVVTKGRKKKGLSIATFEPAKGTLTMAM